MLSFITARSIIMKISTKMWHVLKDGCKILWNLFNCFLNLFLIKFCFLKRFFEFHLVLRNLGFMNQFFHYNLFFFWKDNFSVFEFHQILWKLCFLKVFLIKFYLLKRLFVSLWISSNIVESVSKICFLVNFVFFTRLSVFEFHWILWILWFCVVFVLLCSEIPVNISGIGFQLVPWYLYAYLIYTWNNLISSELMRAVCISVFISWLIAIVITGFQMTLILLMWWIVVVQATCI